MKARSLLPCVLLAFISSSALLLGDVIDSSLVLRFNFDAAPVGDVILDTSPAGGHPGTNAAAVWAASEAGRTGVMNFDGSVPSQITVAPATNLNSSTGA